MGETQDSKAMDTVEKMVVGGGYIVMNSENWTVSASGESVFWNILHCYIIAALSTP